MHTLLLTALLCAFFIPMTAQAQVAQHFHDISIPNLDIPNEDISGIVLNESFMALVSDEGNALQILKKTQKSPKNNQAWSKLAPIKLTNTTDELDLEGIIWQAPYLYAIGSHSAKRKKLDTHLSEEKNLKRLSKIFPEPARHQLFRIELKNDYEVKDIEALSLDDFIAENDILKSFSGIPSKENGIDIEGLSINNQGQLLVGFRGPVIRGNLTAIMQLQLKKKRFEIKKAETLWANLNGLGIRDISKMNDQDEWLILAGDVGDLETPYQVYFWQGQNQLEPMKPLCNLPQSQGKPEGIAFINKQGKVWEFAIVQDGLTNGQPSVFKCEQSR